MDRREAIAIVVFVVGVVLAACGGARKPCDAPIRSLDGAPSASAQPAETTAPNE